MMYKKNKNNIVIFSLEHENKKENLLGQNFAKSLLEIITKLEKESELKGIIILFTNILLFQNMTLIHLLNLINQTPATNTLNLKTLYFEE